MKNNYTVKQRFQYWFDAMMAKGAVAMILLLAMLSLLVVVVGGTIIYLFNIAPEGADSPLGFTEGAWQSLMATLDSGTMGGDEGWDFRGIRLFATLGGIFVISTFIAVLSSAIEARLELLRKGRSTIIEQEHTLIIGWSPKVFYIINELVLANSNQKKPKIVVVSDNDKTMMEDEISNHCTDLKNTKIICRSANTTDIKDLMIVNPMAAKSVLILSNSNSDNPDAQVIKTILALTNQPNKGKDKMHIVAEMIDPKNKEVALMIGKNEVEVLLSGDVISSIMVQTCRQSGLSGVFTELLDFGGDEIYFKEEPSLINATFTQATMSYDTSALLGIVRMNGEILLNPPATTTLIEGDKLIAISADDDTIIKSSIVPIVQHEYIVNKPNAALQPEKILVLGWNKKGEMMVEKMDKYVAKNSIIDIVGLQTSAEYRIELLRANMQNMSINYNQADITDRDFLNSLDLPSYDHVFILSYANGMPPQDADALSLVCLLHIRNIAEKSGRNISVASEMLDANNRELAKITNAEDFIISENYISLLLSQISENKILNQIFSSLFSSEGSEINIKPASNYIITGKPMNFYTIMQSAHNKGEVAIGYKLASEKNNATLSYGIHLNPKKSNTITLSKEDSIIVLAEY